MREPHKNALAPYVPNLETALESARCVHRDPPEIPGGAPLRCANYAEEGSLFCYQHQDSSVDNRKVLQRAQNKMMSMLDTATSVFEGLMEDPDPNVRFKAAEAVMNYSGLSKGETITVEVKHTESTADSIMEKLNKMVENAAESKAVQEEFFSRNGAPEEEFIEAEVIEEQ